MLRSSAILLAALTGIACDGDIASDGAGGGGGEAGGGMAEPPQGLFDCNIPLSCGEFTQHAANVGGSGSRSCVAEVAFTGGIGSTLYRDAPGPYIDVTETLTLYTGDGFAIRQTRHKSCSCVANIPWREPGPIERCRVQLPAEIQSACDADDHEGCVALPYETVTDCVAVEDEPTCTDLARMLAHG